MLYDNKSRFSTLDGKDISFFLGSTFSEYTVLEHENVVKVGPQAPLDKICVLSCGVTTGKTLFHLLVFSVLTASIHLYQIRVRLLVSEDFTVIRLIYSSNSTIFSE
jgi:uncharacterized membrane protein